MMDLLQSFAILMLAIGMLCNAVLIWRMTRAFVATTEVLRMVLFFVGLTR